MSIGYYGLYCQIVPGFLSSQINVVPCQQTPLFPPADHIGGFCVTVNKKPNGGKTCQGVGGRRKLVDNEQSV